MKITFYEEIVNKFGYIDYHNDGRPISRYKNIHLEWNEIATTEDIATLYATTNSIYGGKYYNNTHVRINNEELLVIKFVQNLDGSLDCYTNKIVIKNKEDRIYEKIEALYTEEMEAFEQRSKLQKVKGWFK